MNEDKLNQMCFSDLYFDLSDEIIVAITKDEVVIEVNRKGCEVLGYSKEEIIGKNWFDNFLPDKARKETRSAFHRILDGTERLERYENLVLTRDNGERIVAWHNTLLRDKAGGLDGTLSSGLDITERKQATLALQESELKYRDLADSLAEGVFEADLNGKIIYANRKGLALLGFNQDDLNRGLNILDCVAENYIDFARERFTRVISQEDLGSEEYVLRRKDGTKLPALLHTLAILRDGKVRGIRGIVIDIAKHKQTEQQLAESETRYRSLFDNMLDGFAYCKMIYDSQGQPVDFVYLTVNSSFERLTGLKDVVGKKVTEVIPNIRESNLELFTAYGTVAATGISQRFEIYLKELSAWFSISVYSTEKDYFTVVFDNITERKLGEQALRASEGRLRRIYESGRIGITYWSTDGKIKDANGKFLEMVGYTREDVKADRINWVDITPQEYRYLDERSLEELKATGGNSTPYEKEILSKDGTRIPILISGAMLDEERFNGIAFVVDITKRKKAEQALKYSEERFRTLFETMSEGFALGEMILDDTGKPHDFRYLLVNHSFELLTGLKAAGVVGRTIREVQPQFDPVLIERLGGVASNGKPVHFEEWSTRLHRWFDMNSYRTEPGKFAIVFSDITERKQAEEALRRKTKDLEGANAELQQFAYVASHDLREPLRMITGFTQSLEKRYKDKLDSTANEYIDFIVDGTSRMQNLIDDILVYSRVGTRGVPFEPVNMEKALQDVLVNLKVAIDEAQAKVTHDPLPVVQADPAQMMQVFQNLIGNAIKFHRDGEAPVIHLSVIQEDGEWVFAVKDNGIGIDPELFGRLFTLFQRLNLGDKYPGTGVGLAITKKIVIRHGGRIWVDSQSGKGSTFYFSVPVTAGREENG